MDGQQAERSACRVGKRFSLAVMLAAVSLSGAAGCRALRPASEASPPVAKNKSERPAVLPWRNDEPKIGNASQIVATWTDTVLQQSGVGAQRGFGGRLYFYGSGDPEPIAVAGQLVVYAFDETDRSPTDNKPTRRYVFPPEQFALHKSESDLGVSYSFWLPWDEVGGNQTEVSLIARFEPLKGGVLVVSDQSAVRLPGQYAGPSVIAKAPVTTRVGAVQTVAHETPAAPQPVSTPTSVSSAAVSSNVETTTIPLPNNHRILR